MEPHPVSSHLTCTRIRIYTHTHSLSLSLSHATAPACTRMHTHTHTLSLSPGSHGANPLSLTSPLCTSSIPFGNADTHWMRTPLKLAGRLTIYLSKWSPPRGRCLSTRYLSRPLLSSQSITLGNSLHLCSLPGRDSLGIVNAAYHSLFKDPSTLPYQHFNTLPLDIASATHTAMQHHPPPPFINYPHISAPTQVMPTCHCSEPD